MFNPKEKLKVAVWYENNVNTDDIMPADFLHGGMDWNFADHAFDKIRFLDTAPLGTKAENRVINPDFFMNKEENKDFEVLVTGDDFGCGSSREHAAKALKDIGIKAIIAPSFAKIFYGNAFENGILLISLEKEKVESLFNGYTHISVDLENQTFIASNEEGDELSYSFDIPAFKKLMLSGIDKNEYTHENYGKSISNFRQEQKQENSWI